MKFPGSNGPTPQLLEARLQVAKAKEQLELAKLRLLSPHEASPVSELKATLPADPRASLFRWVLVRAAWLTVGLLGGAVAWSVAL